MSNTSKLPARDFWASISNWLLAIECKDTTENHRQAVHQWYDSFLESDDADDKQMRLEVKMLRDDILDLFNTLDLYDRTQRIEEIQKLAI